MKTYLHIIVEGADFHWMAWFQCTPHIAYGGDAPSVAIHRLLSCTGTDAVTENILVIDDATHDGHLEFLIPHQCRYKIPLPSRN